MLNFLISGQNVFLPRLIVDFANSLHFTNITCHFIVLIHHHIRIGLTGFPILALCLQQFSSRMKAFLGKVNIPPSVPWRGAARSVLYFARCHGCRGSSGSC